MTSLVMQKRLAADILKVGISRVWIDPQRISDVESSVTREDIRKLIEEGVIRKLPVRGISRARYRARMERKRRGRGRGHGSRKGKKGARMGKKEAWMRKIRALRRRLRELRDSGEIDRRTYRMLYMKAKGGEFRSVRQLNEYVKGLGEK